MQQEIAGLSELLTYFNNRGIHTCILYGYANSSRYIQSSDIDLAVTAKKPLSDSDLVTYYIKAVDLLRREVDLSDLRTAKGVFLKEILTTGEILLNKNSEFLGIKAIKMIDYQSDLAPSINSMLKRRLKLAINGK